MDQVDTNLRSTRQRKVILEELRKVHNHPTADELYEMVRKRRPDISLGTVYRNLETLSARGLITKISLAGTRKRFDGRLEQHYHLRCLGCGKVEDLEMTSLGRLDREARRLSNYVITGHSLEFYGLCPACRKTAAGRDKTINTINSPG